MSKRLGMPRPDIRETVDELRTNLGLFSFQRETATTLASQGGTLSLQREIRPGAIIEWLVEKEGAGAIALAMQMMAQFREDGRVWSVIDPGAECFVPAFSGWGIDPSTLLVLRPSTLHETCWSIEQCLRSTGVFGNLGLG